MIKIGSPVVKSIGKIILFFKKIKFKPIKIKLPNFSWPKIILSKWQIEKRQRNWLKLPKIRIPKIKVRFNFPKISIKKKLWCFLFLGLFLTISLFTFYWWIIRDLPNVNLIYNPPNLSTKIVDRNGKILYKFYENENRTWTPLNKIPKNLIEATIAIEDKDFYKHHGLSFKGLITAIFYNFKKNGDDKPRGGSTITQQLVKNIFLGNEKTIKRKIKEGILTLIIEQKMTKDEILERYLNQAPYGGEAYGVQEASQKYFGKNVINLNIIEAAYLAGLPAAPSSYSPYGNNPELGLIRAKHVIEEMVSNNYLNKNEAEKWLNEKINIKTNGKEIKAPHFVFYIKNILEEKYGYANIEKQGLVIKTTLDLNIQEISQKIVADEIEKIESLRISNGAALIIDIKSGDILAMIGSKNYQSKDIEGKFNVTTALRQPGSSIKPINYLLALENGYSLSSTIEDSPVIYPSVNSRQKPYAPQNYNGKYMGTVTLKTALASSLNVPSVKLLEKNGINNMIDLAEDMGITTWNDRSRFGLSLALGSGEVKMTELAQAYSIFANLGNKIEINPILEIDNYLGEKIYQKEIEKEEITKPEYAFMINDALSDNQARSPIFGISSKLVIKGKTVAVKTGTTNNLKDNWCIGWTPSFLVATWVGNNNSTPMSWVASGVTGATPIWNNLMQELLKDKENEQWVVPNNLVKKNICGKEQWIINGSEIKVNCPTLITPTPTN
ncbi:MAG: PBP1A family penicillin-binding protein [Candidatus Shapirobacteria bacterium]